MEEQKRKYRINGMSVNEYFQQRTGCQMTNYFIEHFLNSIDKYGFELFAKGLEICFNRYDLVGFETPADFIKYLYGVLRNLKNNSEWVKLDERY